MKEIGIASLLVILTLGVGCSRPIDHGTAGSETSIVVKNKKPTFEDMVHTLTDCGLEFNSARMSEDLLAEVSRESYETQGYSLIIRELCTYSPPYCDNICGFYDEIEFPNDRTSAAARAKRIQPIIDIMSRSVKITNLQDHFNKQKDEWITYQLDGKEVKVVFREKGRLFGDRLLAHFAKVLRDRNPNKVLARYNAEQHYTILLNTTRTNIKKLNQLGLKFTEVE